MERLLEVPEAPLTPFLISNASMDDGRPSADEWSAKVIFLFAGWFLYRRSGRRVPRY